MSPHFNTPNLFFSELLRSICMYATLPGPPLGPYALEVSLAKPTVPGKASRKACSAAATEEAMPSTVAIVDTGNSPTWPVELFSCFFCFGGAG